MFNFITEYWLAFVFSLVCGCMLWVIKQYYSLSNKEEQNNQDKVLEAINEVKEDVIEIKDELTDVKSELNDVKSELLINTKGTLKLYRDKFVVQCRELLDPDHIITFEEFTSCSHDHDTYKAMGGNSVGDDMFNSVQNKFNAQNLGGE